MALEGPPPSRHVSSTPISHTAASSMLDSFLRNSEAHAHLHPDALITPVGVTFSSHGGPRGGVIIHNLRRVAVGLRGEYLEPERTPEPEEEGAEGVAGGGGALGDKFGARGLGKRYGGEWRDAEMVARQGDGLVIGDVGNRADVVAEDGGEPEVQVTGAEGGKKRKQDEDTKLNKEARKKAKKERGQQRKRENELKKAGTAD